MVSALRAGKGRTGLVLANGGIMTYQHVVLLSTQPRRGSPHYPSKPPLPEVITDIPCPPIAAQANGKAVIEVGLPSPSPPTLYYVRSILISGMTDLHGRL